MKIITLISLLLTMTATAFPQIRKGQFLIGGNIRFESINSENLNIVTDKSIRFLISPNVGYFIIDKLAGGLRVDFGSYHSKSESIETHYITTSISPFIRYYFLPFKNKINVLIDLGYIHNRIKWSSATNPGYYEKGKGYSISVGPSIFLTDQVALEFTLGFRHTTTDNFYKTKSNIINSGFGLQIHLGKTKNRSKF